MPLKLCSYESVVLGKSLLSLCYILRNFLHIAAVVTPCVYSMLYSYCTLFLVLLLFSTIGIFEGNLTKRVLGLDEKDGDVGDGDVHVATACE